VTDLLTNFSHLKYRQPKISEKIVNVMSFESVANRHMLLGDLEYKIPRGKKTDNTVGHMGFGLVHRTHPDHM
jgi:hypothetical protein